MGTAEVKLDGSTGIAVVASMLAKIKVVDLKRPGIVGVALGLAEIKVVDLKRTRIALVKGHTNMLSVAVAALGLAEINLVDLYRMWVVVVVAAFKPIQKKVIALGHTNMLSVVTGVALRQAGMLSVASGHTNMLSVAVGQADMQGVAVVASGQAGRLLRPHKIEIVSCLRLCELRVDAGLRSGQIKTVLWPLTG